MEASMYKSADPAHYIYLPYIELRGSLVTVIESNSINKKFMYRRKSWRNTWGKSKIKSFSGVFRPPESKSELRLNQKSTNHTTVTTLSFPGGSY